MSGAALVSKEPGGGNAAQRFVVLTSNLLCSYKEFGIGPSPTDAIEVDKIVNIHISLEVLSLTVTSSQQSQNLALTMNSKEILIAWKQALSEIGCLFANDNAEDVS